jgi:hypothetical protein
MTTFGLADKLRRTKRSFQLSMIRHDFYPDRWVRSEYAREVKEWEARGRAAPVPSVQKQRIVREYASRFRLSVLVETGTYFGAMVEACKDTFEKIYTIELQEAFCRRAQKRFARFPHIRVLEGDSAIALEAVLGGISERCLFWLDAHYMGGISAKGESACPAMQDLETIASHPVPGHVVLIDDARLFQGRGGWPSLAAVSEFAAAHGWAGDVRDDIIRLTPDADNCRGAR